MALWACGVEFSPHFEQLHTHTLGFSLFPQILFKDSALNSGTALAQEICVPVRESIAFEDEHTVYGAPPPLPLFCSLSSPFSLIQ